MHFQKPLMAHAQRRIDGKQFPNFSRLKILYGLEMVEQTEKWLSIQLASTPVRKKVRKTYF